MPTFSIVSGNGFTGNAQRMELPSSSGFIGFAQNVNYDYSLRLGLFKIDQYGNIDTSFNTGVGFIKDDINPAIVKSFIIDLNGKYLVGGYFSLYNGIGANNIIRLNSDGSIDTTFNIGSGFNNYTNCLLQDSNGKYLVGGYFTGYNGTSSSFIIRLNNNGTIDTSFTIS